MVIEAAESRTNGREHKNICRVIYPGSICKLELKTNQKVKNHFQTYGRWNANCSKMPLREVLNITRICSLDGSINSETKDSIKDSLSLFASIAETKYNSGFKGIVRNQFQCFLTFWQQTLLAYLVCLEQM